MEQDGRPRGIQSRIKFFSEPGWTCKFCGEDNPFSGKFCQKCNRRNVAHERLQKSIKKTAQARTWHCKVCTFINNERFPKCEICYNPRYEEPITNGGEEVQLRKKNKPPEKNSYDSTDGKSKGLPPLHERERKISGEEKKSRVSKFFGFLRGGQKSNEKDVHLRSEAEQNSRPASGIRNSRLYNFIFKEKPPKKDGSERTTTWFVDEPAIDDKKTTGPDQKLGKGDISKQAEPDQHDRRRPGKFDFWEKKEEESKTKDKKFDENRLKEKDKMDVVKIPKKKPQEPVWSCKSCTFNNPESVQKCAMCGMDRPRIEANRPSKLMKRRMLRKGTSLKIADVQKKEEKEAHQKWINITYFCRENGVLFVDDGFMPGVMALYYRPRNDSLNPKWLRCHDIRTHAEDDKDDWVVYRSQPQPEDIEQGTLGNCWFLSALAVLAERRELLEKIILTKKFCKEGAYHVRLCKDGRWKIVLIDDFFPCDKYSRLLYSKAKRKQLWVPLIEKAAAKLHGCYEALTSGRCVEALALLTGEPCETVQLQEQDDDDMEIDKKKIWAKILKARHSRYLMGTSCGSGKMRLQESDHDHFEKMGLIPQHAYSVLEAQDVEGNQLVKIRNPWGTVSWKGKWSDKSSAWSTVSAGAKHNLQLDGNDKGIFWMCLKDFMTYFDSVEICKARPNWSELRIKGSFPPHADQPWKLVSLSIYDRTELDLNIYQRSLRGLGLSNEPFVDMLIVVLENSKKGGNAIFKRVVGNSRRIAKSFTGCEVTLDPGRYTVACLAFKHWQTGVPLSSSFRMETLEELNKDFVLSIHSSNSIMSEEFDTTSPDFNFAIADIMIQLAIEKGKKQELDPKGLTIYGLWWYGAMFVVENSSLDKYGQMKCDCSNSSYLISTRGTFITMDCIPPRHRQVIMLLTPLEPKTGWSTNRSLSYIFDNQPGLFRDWNAPPGTEHVPDIVSDIAGLHSPRPF